MYFSEFIAIIQGMYRKQIEQLHSWGNSPIRKPLILRGVRQVGKSWLVAEFGKGFDSYIEINFDKQKKAKQWFGDDIDIGQLLQTIAIQKGTTIIPGKTLIFLDEIQECENALRSLRYFKEEKPELHVIAAGSLLDFAIEDIGVPVGRVQFMYLYPISFLEFLAIMQRDDLIAYIKKQVNNPTIHELLLELLKTYMFLGGMPAVVQQWLTSKDYILCQQVQDEIIESYQQDFHKYSKSRQIPYITQMFNKIPLCIGNKFKYANVDRNVRSMYLKEALRLLKQAGIAHIFHHTSAQHPPLGSAIDDRKFKVFFFDVGIAQRLLDLDLQQWLPQKLQLNTMGAIAEQFVAQELVAYSKSHKTAKIYYWHREAKSSNAEIDFITLHDGKILPIEVKSAVTGRLRSLHRFLATHENSPKGLKISEGPFANNNNIIEIPLYAIWDFMLSPGDFAD